MRDEFDFVVDGHAVTCKRIQNSTMWTIEVRKDPNYHRYAKLTVQPEDSEGAVEEIVSAWVRDHYPGLTEIATRPVGGRGLV